MYKTQRYSAAISVDEYLRDFVDITAFLECCKACPNYGKIWSCPPYDFDAAEYWKGFQTLELVAVKLIFDPEYAGKEFSSEELSEIMDQSLGKVKARLSQELLQKEKQRPGSVSLSAGSCSLCKGDCTRKKGVHCRYPETMRYSIESLGGNVGLTIQKLMGIELEWMEEGRLPPFFVLVCGLLC